MASNVFFTNLRARNASDSKINKIQRLFDESGMKNLIAENDLTAIKIHFGEKGNDSYINPVFVRQIVDKIKSAKGKPFVTDTNTLYHGERHNAVDHLVTAIEHGFNYAVLGAPVLIADGLTSNNITEVEIDKKHFNKVKIASDIVNADGMIVLSHFKGHELAGFGGAIKNLAMGCAPAKGKRDQHSPRPFVLSSNCKSCGKCIKICPASAVNITNKLANINKDKCIGCCECLTICPFRAIEIDWTTEVIPFMERMTEYALGAVINKQNKTGYINFLINITPDCDCFPFSDSAIVPDIGILASDDPVAIDKASYDLVNKQTGFDDSKLKCNHQSGFDKFKGMRDYTEGFIQIEYGEQIGLGSKNYNLIEI
jgi:uncharacterized Fe-S center protein